MMKITAGHISVTPEEWAELSVKKLTDFQKGVRQVVVDWLNGRESFTLQTSGSSGLPKEIALPVNLLKWSAANTENYINPLDKAAVCCLPLNKAGGFMMLIRSLIFNRDVYLGEPAANPALSSGIKPGFLALTAYQAGSMLSMAEGRAFISKCNKILLGGSEVSLAVKKDLLSLNNEVYLGYGMTETASHIALCRLINERDEPLFDILPGVHIHFGSDKTIIIGIPEFKLEIVTRDYGEVINGKLRLTGRDTGFLNSGGIKIYAPEIESRIGELITNEIVIASIPHSKFGEEIVCIATNVLGETEKSCINNLIGEFTAGKIKIKQWFVVPVIPRVNDKIDRLGVRKMLTNQ